MKMVHQESATASIAAQLPDAIRGVVQRAADLQGRDLSDFILAAAREAAEKAIARHDIIEMTEADQLRFVDALEAPLEIPSGLLNAAEHHRRLTEPS